MATRTQRNTAEQSSAFRNQNNTRIPHSECPCSRAARSERGTNAKLAKTAFTSLGTRIVICKWITIVIMNELNVLGEKTAHTQSASLSGARSVPCSVITICVSSKTSHFHHLEMCLRWMPATFSYFVSHFFPPRSAAAARALLSRSPATRIQLMCSRAGFQLSDAKTNENFIGINLSALPATDFSALSFAHSLSRAYIKLFLLEAFSKNRSWLSENLNVIWLPIVSPGMRTALRQSGLLDGESERPETASIFIEIWFSVFPHFRWQQGKLGARRDANYYAGKL